MFFLLRAENTIRSITKAAHEKKEILSEQCLWQLSWNQMFQIRTTAQKKDLSELLSPRRRNMSH